ncbi:MAG: NAD(P)H-dependent oxidoreductase [Pasteurellaceae bacterium]|nr:NAD(P)H-dependent oxidoreductase [Pasteurellaceae bacterium]
MTKQVAVLIGSNSKTSFSKLVFNYLTQVAPATIQLNLIQIADLPLYDRDLDENSPAEYTRFREQIAKSDAVLFIAPEHNGAIPAMIKNAIDVASRPMGKTLWPGKPAGIVTLGGAMQGGVRVADQLRTIASAGFVAMPVYTLNANISQVFSLFNDKGEIVVEPVAEMLQNFIQGYADFVQKF